MEASRRERKVVSVLFCDLAGFTARAEALDPEDVADLLARYHARARSLLERYGGTVEKFIGDAVVALFGAPTAHEDDPERAVRAALAIRDWALAEENVQVRIAVTTGEAVVRLGARLGEGEGMAAGDVVNTAARLQAAAPLNSVLVDETTARATRQAIDYGEAEPVLAKGKTRPISVWEAVQARARLGVDLAPEPAAPLVGRQRELDLLRDALERAHRQRSPQLVTLVGVPGIGKSRLVHELSRIVGRRARARHLAPGPLPPLRQRRRLLGAGRDRQGPGRHPGGRRGGGSAGEAPPRRCRGGRGPGRPLDRGSASAPGRAGGGI